MTRARDLVGTSREQWEDYIAVLAVCAFLRAHAKPLGIGDRVVVYTPWQMHDEDGLFLPMLGPYWEGVIVGTPVSPDHGQQFIVDRGSPHARHLFHANWVFPEWARDRVRIAAKHEDGTVDLEIVRD